MYNFDEIIDRKDTNSVKYGASKLMYPAIPDNFIPMWIADMDFACPQPILDAMKARIDRRILGYSMIQDPEYYAALSQWMKVRHNWDADVKTNMFSAGVITVLNAAVETITNVGDGVILNTPAYHPFDDAIKKHGRTSVYSRLKNDNGIYSMDWQDFEEKAKNPKNTLYFLCNPHNPTGRVWTKEELLKIGEICFSNNVFVISDEIHFDFIRANCKHTVFASLFPKEKNLITCTAPSKTFNLAGNQLSNIFVANPEIAQKWQSTSALGHPNPLSIEACRAAYSQCGDWLDELNEYIDENFRVFADRIKKEMPKVKFNIPESTYLAWIDVSECGFIKQDLILRLVKAGLHLEYEGEFVENDPDHIRINLACPRSVLNKAIDAMVTVLGEGAKPAAKRFSKGEKLLDFTVDTQLDTGVQLSKLVKDKNTLLLFLRYIGCPLCQLDMHNLKENYSEIEKTGGQVIVVLQSKQEKLMQELKNEAAFPFTIICDPKEVLYEGLGIFAASSQMELFDSKLMDKMAQVQAKGIQHGEYEGNEMQLPAAIAINPKMEITYIHYSKGLADLPDVAQMAEILK